MDNPTTSKPFVPRLSLRPREAAEALGVSERLLSDLTSRGAIPHFRIGRAVIYPVSALQDWLRQLAKEAGNES